MILEKIVSLKLIFIGMAGMPIFQTWIKENIVRILEIIFILFVFIYNMNSRLDQQSETLNQVTEDIEIINNTMNNIRIDVAVLRVKVDNVQKQLDDHDKKRSSLNGAITQ